MLSWPKIPEEQRWGHEFLAARAGVRLDSSTDFLFWHDDADTAPVWVVGFHLWSGHTCHIVWANNRTRFVPRKLLQAMFTYAFRVKNLALIFGGYDSADPAAGRIQEWIGFKEIWRGPGLNLSGGDMVLTTMHRGECRWIKE